MARNLVLFSDGTGNSSAKLFKTNVWRLYQALDFSAEDPAQPDQTLQIARYDNGVGSSSLIPLAWLSGVFGWGLKRNVIDLYLFLCKNYRPGDRIYCFGFSRGGFTIRVLTGLINSQGLITEESHEELIRLANKAFNEYRNDRNRKLFGREGILNQINTFLRRVIDRVISSKPNIAKPEKSKVVPPITFVGIWDTVAAYGLPFKELTQTFKSIFPLSNIDRNLSGNVQRAYHALALDDERETFTPLLWNEGPLPGQNMNTKNIDQERLSQVWFAGSHSNVGGGYPDDGLSYVSLNWMMGEAERAGLIFETGTRNFIRAAVNKEGKFYNSRRGFGSFYRYLPRKLTELINNTEDPINKVVIPRPKIHESVFNRIRNQVDGYLPIGLPSKYAVVKDNGEILDIEQVQGKGSFLLEHPTQAENRRNLQEHVWTIIWWKRIVYFACINLLIALILFPIYMPAIGACSGIICFFSPIVDAMGKMLFLPWIAYRWHDAYTSSPGTFLFLISLLSIMTYLGKLLKTKIFTMNHNIWKPVIKNPLSIVSSITPLPKQTLLRLRVTGFLGKYFAVLSFILVNIVAMCLVMGGINKGIFSMMSSAGFVCAHYSEEKSLFTPSSLCWASGFWLAEGKQYVITMSIDDSKWMDASIQAGIEGFNWERMPSIAYPFVFARRHIWEPWFKPIAKIGRHGSDEYPLNFDQRWNPLSRKQEFTTKLKARRDGELFLFVNDIVLPVPKNWQVFYMNNSGEAEVHVAEIKEDTRFLER